MDHLAVNNLHVQLTEQGYGGSLQELQALLDEAYDATQERLALAWCTGRRATRQLAALEAAFAHAKKRKMTHTINFMPDRVSVVLSRERGFKGVTLGAVSVYDNLVSWRYYRDNEFIGEKVLRR